MTATPSPVGPAPRRPAVWVNFAASADGRLAYAGGRRARLSSAEDLRRVQRLRANADAILVGVGTVEKDDPSLRVHWDLLGEPEGRSPTRVVVDSTGRVPASARVLDGSVRTIVAVSERCRRDFPSSVERITVGRDRVDLSALFVRLHGLGIRRLMVEGGSEILSTVFRERLFDRCTVYYAPVVIGGRTAPPIAAGPDPAGERDAVALTLVGLERLGEGFVASYVPADAPAGSGAGASTEWDRPRPPGIR
jgi:2,5-diamino-6-(ribosylamino)-4(3H)-pyrimidinone 5'-phosphate reductase